MRTLNRVGGSKHYSLTVLLDKDQADSLKKHLQHTGQRESVFVRELIQQRLSHLEDDPDNRESQGV